MWVVSRVTPELVPECREGSGCINIWGRAVPGKGTQLGQQRAEPVSLVSERRWKWDPEAGIRLLHPLGPGQLTTVRSWLLSLNSLGSHWGVLSKRGTSSPSCREKSVWLLISVNKGVRGGRREAVEAGRPRGREYSHWQETGA